MEAIIIITAFFAFGIGFAVGCSVMANIAVKGMKKIV